MPRPLAFRLDSRGWRFGAALLSGVLQYFATGLEPWWWAAWLAPIPLLVAAFRASTREAWALAVIAGLIGSASTASFYAMVIGPIGSAFVMMLRGLVSGIVVAYTRAVVLGSRHWLTAFVYPALMAGFDTTVAAVSRRTAPGCSPPTASSSLTTRSTISYRDWRRPSHREENLSSAR